MAHHMPMEKETPQGWTWKNRPGYKPLLLLLAALVFTAIVILPPPQSMLDMVSKVSPPGYQLGTGCNTITDTINKKLRPEAFKASKDGTPAQTSSRHEPLLTPEDVAHMAKIMVGILLLAAFLWGTESLPLGATDILVGVMLYLFAILPINEISQAYMKDAVFFIFRHIGRGCGGGQDRSGQTHRPDSAQPHQEYQGLCISFSAHAGDVGRIFIRTRPGGAADPGIDGHLQGHLQNQWG